MIKGRLSLILLIGIFVSSGVFALDNPSSNWQSNQPTFDNLYASDFENYWPILNDMKNDQCNATTDFVIGIPPGGCSPMVVRSDLLAEQNVPVFCQLYAIKVNPLIKVSSIKSISFKGDYPEGVRSVVYHPARAAVKSYTTLLGDPTLENIGYVVIILKQEKVEANMEEWGAGNLTATMAYDGEEAFGTGKGDYYLEPMSEDEWDRKYVENSFWNGRGFLRVLDVGEGSAKIQVMESRDKVLRTLTLKEGETSSSSYLPGFYCKAGLKVKLTDITTQEDMARLNVDGNDVWVREGSKFLDGKCSVKKLNVRGNNDGEITLSCSGAGKIAPLSLSGVGVMLRMSTEEEFVERKVGERIGDGGKYVIYYGTHPSEDTEFVILATNIPKDKDVTTIRDKLISTGSFDDFKNEVEKIKISGLAIFSKEDKDFFDGLSGTSTIDGKSDKYFDKSVVVVRDELVEDYGSEEKEAGGTWAEEALYEEIVLAGEIGNFSAQRMLMDLFLDDYPSANNVDYVRDMRAKLDGTDYSESFVSVYVGNEFQSISVVDFKAVAEGEKRGDLKVGGQSKNGYNESQNISMGSSGVLEIRTILPGSVKVYFKSKVENAKGDARSRPATIKEGERTTFNGVEVYVSNIIVNEVAHVSLIPDVKHEKSEADFTFRIGVEKRAIELSPEKTQRMIANLNKSIAKWEDIVERLGDVVTGLKGACFATSTILMVKNMLSGTGGAGAARSKVMAEYREICDTDSKYREMSRTECYNKLNENGDIDNAVETMAGNLKSVNADMEGCQNEAGVVGDSGGIIGGKSVVKEKEYRECLARKIGVGTKIEVEGVDRPLEVSGDLSLSQLQAIMLWQKSEGVGKKAVKGEMDGALRYVALSQENEGVKSIKADEYKFKVEGETVEIPVSIMSGGNGNLIDEKERFDKSELESLGLNWEDLQLSDKVDGEIGAQIISSGSHDYLYLFPSEGGGQHGIYEVVSKGGKLSLVKEVDNKVEKLDKIPYSKDGVSVQMLDAGSCSNDWRSKAQVQYFDIGDNAGLPAIVPFGYPGKSLDGGWYVWVSNSGGDVFSSSVQGYKASGDVSNFYICNIGINGLMESKGGDDDCLSFSENSIPESKKFGLCKNVDMTKLYDRAREAIRQASGQAKNDKINILGESIDRGKPVNTPSVECQEFMSPSDCKLMFNVCDPVICPPSRCNFDDKFPVADVIQTGIIGSLVLCLPNAKEGIFMPICLSGVHAGLDSYVSILRSERECLEHSLETGELVGICDQITSIYKCEFFWRQLSPLMDKLVPGVIDYAIGGNKVRGGGEYALVASAWENTKKSISYFKDTYAQNAFRAFNIRSTQEVGGSVCKAFVGSSVPGSANFIENLLAPESPSQFYAQFSEITFTEATVPATSQYKVYFHIYAGNDAGVQYKVYLKDPPASSYYASTPEISNGEMSGYIAAGSSADKSVDFTAPAGYKELCVVINAQEKCGFKQVTTSFGIDYLAKKYTEDQATQEDIKSEKECISGSPSALSMATLNLQAGAEETINPEIALRGIVRICATNNPDSGIAKGDLVGCSEEGDCDKGFECDGGYCKSKSEDDVMQNSGSKWKDVGYCGDVNLRCWLDIESVEDDLETISTFEGTTFDELDRLKGLINSTRLDLEAVAKLLEKARIDIEALSISRSEVDGLNIVFDLERVIGNDSASGAGTNGDRAEALSLKASVYRLLVGLASEDEVIKVAEVRDNEELEVNEGDSKVDKEDISCELFCEDSGYGDNSIEMTASECERRDGFFDYEVEEGCCCSGNIEGVGRVESLWESLKFWEDDEEEGEADVEVSTIMNCRVENGNKVIDIVGNLKAKYGDVDKYIEAETGAKSLECLALMVAMQESKLSHCGVVERGTVVECLECDGSNLIKGDDGKSLGIMQINSGVHTAGDFAVLENNVEYAVEKILISKYLRYRDDSNYPRDYLCHPDDNVQYGGWMAALRWYNGWNTKCKTSEGDVIGDPEYVENVLKHEAKIEEMFPEVCGE